jgi:hypothetical protein
VLTYADAVVGDERKVTYVHTYTPQVTYVHTYTHQTGATDRQQTDKREREEGGGGRERERKGGGGGEREHLCTHTRHARTKVLNADRQTERYVSRGPPA